MAWLPRSLLLYSIIIVAIELRYSSSSEAEFRCKRSNSAVSFRCPTTDARIKEVRWRRVGLPGPEWLEDRGRVYISDDSGLLIKGLRTNDSAIYEAHAWVMGEMSNSEPLCRWSLWVSPDGVCQTFPKLRGKKSIVVKRGQTVCFNSRLETGQPAFLPFKLKMLILHFNMTRAEPQPNMLESDRVEGVRSLNMCIHDVTMYDSGVYTQYAVGSTGSVKRPIRLRVREDARILKAPQSADVQLFTRVSLSCVARGNPLPILSWYKDGKHLARLRRQRFKMIAHGNQSIVMTFQAKPKHYESSSQLIIRQMNAGHVGTYRCVAENKGRFPGRDVRDAQLLLLKRHYQSGLREEKANPTTSHPTKDQVLV